MKSVIIFRILFLVIIMHSLNISVSAQDRNISINEVYPADMFIENGGRLINVKTSLTYLGIGPNATGNGINDDSDEIIAAIDWVMNQLKAWFEGGGSVHWHKYYIIYFPDGVYKVSKPLVYSGGRVIDPLYPSATNREGTEKLMLVGQSRKNTIIKLVDSAPGFGSAFSKPVVSFSRFDLGTIFNNMPATMQFRNFTINTGTGNPGAIGVDFYGANVARLDNIKVVGDGKIGVHIRIGSAHGYYSNIVVEGMDYGLYIEGNEESHPTIEYLTLHNQNINAIYLKGMSVTMRKVESTNSVNATRLVGNGSKLPHLVIVDGSFAGGDSSNTAILIDAGFLYSRNINVQGYGSAVRKQSTIVRTGSIDEYVSTDITTYSSSRVRSTAIKSMNLPIEEYPIIPWISDFSQWANVNNYPGVTTAEKIQNAMNSGKKVVYFPNNEYTINSTISIPASVEQIIGSCAHLSGSGALFNVDNSSTNLLLFNGVNMNSGFIRQTAQRNLLLETTFSGGAPYDSDLTSQGTKVFVNNTHGLLRGSGQSNNVKMWIRYNNNEKADDWQFTADPGSQIVMLGFKSEKTFSVFRILDGAMFEVIGGVLNRFSTAPSSQQVGILNQNGHTSLIMSSNGPNRNWSPMINDVQGSESKIWQMNHFPDRGWGGNIVIPVYSSYNPAIIPIQGNFP
ncbi:MAG: glycosyl hydrolase family 28-related protein [Bacteroidales bacterium]